MLGLYDLYEDRINDDVFDFVLNDPLYAGTVRFAVGGPRSGNLTMTLPPAVLRNLGTGVIVSGRARSVATLPGGVLRARGQEAARCTLRVRNGDRAGNVFRPRNV